MGSPAYTNPRQTGVGHIIGLAWDSSIHKFGIDRGAGVRNDLGNPDRFQLWFEFGDITKGIAETWKGQRLVDGLPIVVTTFERDQVRYEVEQFAVAAGRPPARSSRRHADGSPGAGPPGLARWKGAPGARYAESPAARLRPG